MPIYGFKICQHVLRYPSSQIQYFPFERFYIVPENEKGCLPKMFPYYYHMPLNAEIIDILKNMNGYSTLRGLHSSARPETLKANTQELEGIWDDLKATPSLLVIPTRTHKLRDNQRLIQYFNSQVLKKHFNARLNLPPIALHTPTRDIALICAACKEYLEYLEGKCAPGRGSCQHPSKFIKI